MNYDYIIIDNIPCYGLVYALTSIYAPDICIVPLRLTTNDLGRTIQMIKKLQEYASEYEISKEEFYSKIYFIFNRIEHNRKPKIPDYKEELKIVCPLSNLFNDYIVKRIAFSRIGTEEEGKDDIKSVKEAFTPFYEEFEREFF